MNDTVKRLILPGIIILIGLLLLIVGVTNNQNTPFIIGSFAVLACGIIYTLDVMGIISKMIQRVLVAVLILSSIGLTALDYKSIKDPIDFQNEKERRYSHVIQRLKDLRSAQLAHKAVKGTFTDNFDSLLYFIQTDSFQVVKSIGQVPDSLAEKFGLAGGEREAVKMGIVSRDTSMIPIKDSIFSVWNLRNHHGEFYLDSLPYVPFSNGTQFKIAAGEISRTGGSKVKVFQITDAAPFDEFDVMQVGSMSEPSTSGNWE